MSKKELHEYLEMSWDFSFSKELVENNLDYLEDIYRQPECPSNKKGVLWRKIWHEYSKPREISPLVYYMSLKLNETEQLYFEATKGNDKESKLVQKLKDQLDDEKSKLREAEDRLEDRQKVPENAYISDIRYLLNELKQRTGLEPDSFDLKSRRYFNKFKNERNCE